ncbi:hypothetical protein GGD38_006521 [Chitinophagaceae bacterium OAS944]|nr:hypothetical protein [Chitinophagaceae bacterium OAS944]
MITKTNNDIDDMVFNIGYEDSNTKFQISNHKFQINTKSQISK